MERGTFRPLATAVVKWRRHDEGGRQNPPTGPIYAATAVFGEPGKTTYAPDDHVSIVLRFVEGYASTTDWEPAEIDFLARELVRDRLAPGVRLLVMEGARVVAECEVIAVLSEV